MANNQRSRQSSLRDSSPSGLDDGTFILKAGVRDYVVVVLALNIANILLYNTGLIDWKNDNFDVIWATGLCAFNIAGVVMLQLFNRR